MRILSLLSILGLLGLSSPVYAYPEYPPFEHTQFADDHGMYRFWEGCWWQVFDPYVYLLCNESTGDTVYLLLPDGQVVAATQDDLNRLYALLRQLGVPLHSLSSAFNIPPVPRNFSRASAGRLTAAPGDGIRLSDYYGGFANRSFGISSFDGVSFDSGFSSIGDNEYGIFRFNADGTLDRSSSTFSVSNGNGSSSSSGTAQRGSTGAFSGGDGFFSEGNLRTRMPNIFYEPLDTIGCSAIDDYADGGIFGPIPCTSYPGVFGPVPEY